MVEICFNGMTMNDIKKISHVINHSHIMCVMVSFDKNFMKDISGMEAYPHSILSYTNLYFLTLYIMIQIFMIDI